MKNLGLFNFSAFVCAVITASTEAVNDTMCRFLFTAQPSLPQ